jgi:hypothetical protein
MEMAGRQPLESKLRWRIILKAKSASPFNERSAGEVVGEVTRAAL